jgi:hypothetical protein
MDRIDSLLNGAKPLSPSVKHALAFARNSINKYYSKTDLSNVYRIAMVLHPQLKLKYFQQHGWTQDWIRTAETIVREEFAKYNGPSEPAPVLIRAIYPLLSYLIISWLSQATALVDDMDTMTDFLDILMEGLADVNELDDYLSQAIEKVSDPISWWWDHRKVYPKLSAMAFDYLSVPGKQSLRLALRHN